jgi:hypothetical protein
MVSPANRQEIGDLTPQPHPDAWEDCQRRIREAKKQSTERQGCHKQDGFLESWIFL